MLKKRILFISLVVLFSMVTNVFAANCVLWVRDNRAKWLPYGLTTYSDKINKKGFKAKPKDVKAGDVVVMNIYPPYGHVAYVKKVKNGILTIEESNYPLNKSYNTRSDTASKLKVVGYFRK